MKAKIISVEYIKEYPSQYGVLHLHRVTYNKETAFYSSKAKDQKKFITGQEAEFNEIAKEGKNGRYLVIKPEYSGDPKSGFGKRVKQEQSRYSGFAVSYAKDLVIAGKIPLDDIFPFSTQLFEHMVTLDKSLKT